MNPSTSVTHPLEQLILDPEIHQININGSLYHDLASVMNCCYQPAWNNSTPEAHDVPPMMSPTFYMHIPHGSMHIATYNLRDESLRDMDITFRNEDMKRWMMAIMEMIRVQAEASCNIALKPEPHVELKFMLKTIILIKIYVSGFSLFDYVQLLSKMNVSNSALASVMGLPFTIDIYKLGIEYAREMSRRSESLLPPMQAPIQPEHNPAVNSNYINLNNAGQKEVSNAVDQFYRLHNNEIDPNQIINNIAYQLKMAYGDPKTKVEEFIPKANLIFQNAKKLAMTNDKLQATDSEIQSFKNITEEIHAVARDAWNRAGRPPQGPMSFIESARSAVYAKHPGKKPSEMTPEERIQYNSNYGSMGKPNWDHGTTVLDLQDPATAFALSRLATDLRATYNYKTEWAMSEAYARLSNMPAEERQRFIENMNKTATAEELKYPTETKDGKLPDLPKDDFGIQQMWTQKQEPTSLMEEAMAGAAELDTTSTPATVPDIETLTVDAQHLESLKNKQEMDSNSKFLHEQMMRAAEQSKKDEEKKEYLQAPVQPQVTPTPVEDISQEAADAAVVDEFFGTPVTEPAPIVNHDEELKPEDPLAQAPTVVMGEDTAKDQNKQA